MLRLTMRTGPLLALAAMLLAGCAAQTSSPSARKGAIPPSPALRVGVASTSPPFAFWQGGKLVGLEVDFARALAGALGRPLELREMGWDHLTPVLLEGGIDLIMSGMTITPARQLRIAFSEPYLRSGLLAVVRRGDGDRYPSGKSVLARAGAIGVVANTTGDRFVRDQTLGTSVSAYPTPGTAVAELQEGRLDAVVHDAPVLLWFVSGNESALAPVLDPLNREDLGWGMRQGDDQLRAAVNGVLARWRQDGTRERIVAQWIPYWSRLEGEGRSR